jgi:hypothetical protein
MMSMPLCSSFCNTGFGGRGMQGLSPVPMYVRGGVVLEGEGRLLEAT